MKQKFIGLVACIAVLFPVGVGAFSAQNDHASTVTWLSEEMTKLRITDDLELVTSHAESPLSLLVHVAITPKHIAVDGKPLIALHRSPNGPIIPEDELKGALVPELYDFLLERVEDRKVMRRLVDDPHFDSNGRIALSIDRRTPFTTLRSVMYTAGQAQYGNFHFVVKNPLMKSLSSISNHLPAIGPPRPMDDFDEEEPLNLSLFVEQKGLTLMGSFPSSNQWSFVCLSTPCAGLQEYDWKGLNEALAGIKALYPDEVTIIVVPERDVPFSVLAKAIDYARWAPMIPLESEEQAWKQWQNSRSTLFDIPVIAGGAR